MAEKISIALKQMSTRRYLLLRSLIERTGDKVTPGWTFTESLGVAEVVLYDPQEAPSPDQQSTRPDAIELPVVSDREDLAAGELGLHFPPSLPEFKQFLADVEKQLTTTHEARQQETTNCAPQPAQCTEPTPAEFTETDGGQGSQARTIFEAAVHVVQGRTEAFGFESQGVHFALALSDGRPALHSDTDATLAALVQSDTFISDAQIAPTDAALLVRPGDTGAAHLMLWELAAHAARYELLGVHPESKLMLRRWPNPPSRAIKSPDAMRLCSRVAPGTATPAQLLASNQFAPFDTRTLLNAGLLLGFIQSDRRPAAAAAPDNGAPQEHRHGALLSALRSAFGLMARHP